MKPISNYVILEIDTSLEGKVVFKNGTEIQIDTRWEEYQHSVQEGVVFVVPDGLSSKMVNAFGSSVDINNMVMPNVGDKVFFHHMVHREKNIPHSMLNGLKPSEGKRFFFCEYSNLFFRKNEDKIECFNDFVAVKKVLTGEGGSDELKTSSNLEIVSFKKEKEQHGKIIASSPRAEEYGIHEGDLILFTKNCHYWVKVDGEEIYRIEFKDIEAMFNKSSIFDTV